MQYLEQTLKLTYEEGIQMLKVGLKHLLVIVECRLALCCIYMITTTYISIDGLSNWQDAGTELEPMGDLTTEAERKLGYPFMVLWSMFQDRQWI